MSAHTPGPWHITPQSQIAGIGNIDHLFSVAHRQNERVSFVLCEMVEENNARLIAAAPDLLQWIQVLLDQVDYTAGACSLTEMVGACLPLDVIKNTRAAIAKATGAESKEAA